MHSIPDNTAASPIELPDGRSLSFERPLVMGVLNVTPDSFSDGGSYFDTQSAIARAEEMLKAGADIIDIGAESSRPGADPISEEEEQTRLLPVLREIRKLDSVPISVDSYRSSTARIAINEGADIINDISALRSDRSMAKLISESKVAVVLMHMLGNPQTMQDSPAYLNCLDEIKTFFKERLSYCDENQISRNRIIIDPGIGFGKRLKDNLSILEGLETFKSLECPILIGTSRKSFIDLVSKRTQNPHERLGGSIASVLLAISKGASIVRVHDVGQTVEAIKMTMAISEAG